MTQTTKGIIAMIGACTVWGLSPLYYKQLSDVPPPELLSHRTLWSVILFGLILTLQGRLREIFAVFRNGAVLRMVALASVMISANWFIFILSIQIDHATEASLGYYIFPLMAVLIGRFWFAEALGRAQWASVMLAATAVAVLTWGLGVTPWISLVLSSTFALYGAIKKGLSLGPVLSVTCEILVLMPLWLAVLAYAHGTGQGAFGRDPGESLMLMMSGPLTAVPLILFSYAARRVALSTVGLMQYINPTLQFICAVVVFGEPFTGWHLLAFCLIWIALALFSVAALRQDRAARRAVIAEVGLSTQVRNAPSDSSAKP